MAVKIQPYSLTQMQDLVRHSVATMDERHRRWRLIEALYRTGSLRQAEQVQAGKLTDFFPHLSEHVVNMILPHINIILASVVSRDPQFVAVPYAGGEEAELNSEVADAVINYFWKRLRTTRELRDATADAVRLGSGFVKVGWTHIEEEAELDGSARREIALDKYNDERLTAILEDRDFDGRIEVMERSVPSSMMRVIRSEPFAEYVSPYDIFVPNNARRIEDAQWVAHRITMHVDEVLANPEFDVNEDTVVRDGATVNPADEYQAEWRRQVEEVQGSHYSDLALDTATYWEFYDMRTRQLSVFQLESPDPLWQGDLPWSHRYPPFVHVRNFTSSGNDFWGFGDIDNVASLQEMMNELITEQFENARRAGQKYLVRKDAVTEELIAALESSESDVVAQVEVPNGEPLDQIIVPVFRAALANDIYAAKAEIQAYMQEVLGINDFQSGGMGADRMSATAAAVVEGVATLRAQDKIQSVEEAAAQIGTLMFLLCQEYLDEPTAIRVAGFEGAQWPEVSKEDLYGEFLISIEGGSMKALNPATKEQQGLRTLNQVVPMLTQLGFDPQPALRSALRDLGYNPDEMLVQAPQQAPVPGGAPQGGAPSNGDLMAAMGGPPQPAEAQASGNVAL
jgi:hypothetical protein